MSKPIEGNPWVWVVVQDPGNNEQFLGQRYEDDQTAFLPIFLEKEAAQQCLPLMPRNEKSTYEVQAIRYNEFVRHADQNDFMVFILDGAGKILDKITP